MGNGVSRVPQQQTKYTRESVHDLVDYGCFLPSPLLNCHTSGCGTTSSTFRALSGLSNHKATVRSALSTHGRRRIRPHDLKAFSTIVDKAPVTVAPADVFEVLADQRGDRSVLRMSDGESGWPPAAPARTPMDGSVSHVYPVAHATCRLRWYRAGHRRPIRP